MGVLAKISYVAKGKQKMKNETCLIILKEKGECRYCLNNCEGEYGWADEKEFIDICDDCLSNKLAENENFKLK